jgi:uncharacterized repeat protein (TIGR01451 family)
MSDTGGGHGITNVTLTFSDTAAALPDSSTISAGDFAPTDYETGDVFPPPAPAGATSDNLAGFNGTSPNGTWSLYVADDSTGDSGIVSGGWTLTLTTVSPVNPVTDLELTMNGTPGSLYVGSAITYDLGVVNHGGAEATNVSVVNTLPLGVSLVSATSSQGSVSNSGNVVTIHLGSLAASATATATIRVVPEFGGTLVNSATVSGSGFDLNVVNNTDQTTTTVIIPVRVSLTEVTYTNAQVQFTLVGDPGMTYVVQGSTNLTTWTALSTNTAAAGGTVKFTDTSAASFPLRFYRAVRLIP